MGAGAFGGNLGQFRSTVVEGAAHAKAGACARRLLEAEW